MRFLLVIAILFFMITPAQAQSLTGASPSSNNNTQPLEITADETLEWHKAKQKFIARGAVIARQGDVEIRADILTADYHETPSSSFDIYRLTATGHVVILSQGSTATGDKATYDVPSGYAVITGKNLTLNTTEQKVIARDKFEYFVTNSRLNAIGDVRVLRADGNKLRADTAAALFTQNAQGKRTLKELNANGNVVITTPDETLYGAQGKYNAGSDTAELIGNVKIERGQNTLEGARAEVSLTTNISRIIGGDPASGNGRVRGVFYPGTEKGQNP